MLKPTLKIKTQDNPLEVLTANMIALQMQAKLFHLNVKGPRFYGDHKTYDGIYEMADDWFDTLAERMRVLEMPVPVCPAWVLTHSLIEGGSEEDSAEAMAVSMVSSLEILSEHINEKFDGFDDTTLNIVQELDAEIGKQLYFVRSSL
ncbi:MAG: hypothetical protein ACRC0G_10640 [Fusobacteriaceae bacterium]